jgi:mRNA-degrading endonuclease toxin of MazEF toxin-antitoxin module
VFPGECAAFVVISSDHWNRRDVHEVLGVELVPEEDPGRYSPVIDVEGQTYTVAAEAIVRIPVAGFSRASAHLDEKTLGPIDVALEQALFGPARPTRGSARPPGFPYAGHIRFADLRIPGEGDKPVVIVSTEAFAADTDYELVIACRASSNARQVTQFDVALSAGGKVVCSDLRTIPTRHLRERTTRAGAVTATERRAIMQAVRRMVGLA